MTGAGCDERVEESIERDRGAAACRVPIAGVADHVPSIGPIISSAMVAAIGRGEVFSKGRDLGA